MGRGSLMLCAVAVFLLASGSHAIPPRPAQVCSAGKLVASGAEAHAKLKCAKRGLTTGTTTACTAAAAARRSAAFTHFEGPRACLATGDAGALGADVDALVDAWLDLLLPNGAQGSRCTRGQLSATARAIKKAVNAHARDVRNPDAARLADELEAVEVELELTFARVRARGDCLADAAATDLLPLLMQSAADLRDRLPSTSQVACPCWPPGILDTAFPPGYFDQNGLGGVVCVATPTLFGFASVATCDFSLPHEPVIIARRGLAVASPDRTIFVDAFSCSSVQTDTCDTSAAQNDACLIELLASDVFRSACE